MSRNRASLQSRIVSGSLRILGINRMWKKTGASLRQELESKQLKESSEPPLKITRRYSVVQDEIAGHPYYTLGKKDKRGSKHLLYLHGGGYVLKISSMHWEFIADMVERLDCTVIVPMYPLVPRYGHEDVFQMIVPLYQQIRLMAADEDIAVMGDSAGGGMGLALAQLLKEHNIPQPGNIILISPVLDTTLSNPEIREVEGKDPISATPAIREIAEWYAGKREVRHPLISPLFGDCEDLGRISLFIGTHDILFPDVRKLRDRMQELGIPFDYFEYPKMLHVWPLFFFPESKKARAQIRDIIQRGVSSEF